MVSPIGRAELGIHSGVYLSDGAPYVAIKPDGVEAHLESGAARLAGYDLIVADVEASADADWVAVVRDALQGGDPDGRDPLEDIDRRVAEMYNHVKHRRGRRP